MLDELQHLKGRVAVVTGGFSGIGLASALSLARQGAAVALGARTVAAEPQQQLADIGASVYAGSLDVRDSASVTRFISEAEATLGPSDIVVNSAGISTSQSVADHDEQTWIDVIDTNLIGCFRIIHTCLPGMIERGWGRIVSIGSTAARTAVPGHSAYCASKSGLLGLNRAVALEGAAHGVTATVVSPTWVQTDMFNASFKAKAEKNGTGLDDEIAKIISQSSQQRLVQPNELGELAAYLCRDEAAPITMEDIQVNAAAWW